MNASPVWIIAKRELDSFFDSLVAYILLIAFWPLPEYLPGCKDQIFSFENKPIYKSFLALLTGLCFLYSSFDHASIGRRKEDRND